MPDLIVDKSVTYTDAESGSPYELTAQVRISCTMAMRNKHTLSASTPIIVFQTEVLPFATGKVAYVCIKNIGANTAYVAFQDNVATDGNFFEIPAGAVMDFFGSDISIAGTDTLQYVFAKGDTVVEVDAFA